MPIPGGSGGTYPAWGPTLDQIAVYVPWLTVNITVPGQQLYLNTFDERTSPDGTIAAQHATDATVVIAGRIASMPISLYAYAAVVAAKYAAATLALAYARDDTGRDQAETLMTAALAAIDALVDAADNAGASTLSARPVGYAPEPVAWGDDLILGVRGTTLFTGREYLWPE